MIDYLESQNVHHVITNGLVKGKYYKVYVTQVNKAGIESDKSLPTIVRVGDIEAPPQPYLSVDSEKYSNGCVADGMVVNVSLQWTPSVCDDLNNYVLYIWKNKPSDWHTDGVYERDSLGDSTEVRILPNTSTRITIAGNKPNGFVYFGIQAVDYSKNASDVSVVRVLVEDKDVLQQPNSPLSVQSYGSWAIKGVLECPAIDYVDYIVFYRDEGKEVARVKFAPNLPASFVDHLDISDGLSHYYTYQFVTYDGRKTPLSPPSKLASAKSIDLSMMNKQALESLREAWRSDDVSTSAAIEEAARQQKKETDALANKIAAADDKYDELFSEFKVMAKQFELLSAEVRAKDEIISSLQTQITQNANQIQLRATREDVKTESNDIRSAYTAALSVQADKIATVVSSISGIASQITQMDNAIQAKVSQDSLTAQIALAVQNGISTACIEADRIILKGQLLMEGNARFHGILYASDIGLVDKNGGLVWGSWSGPKTANIYKKDLRDGWSMISPVQHVIRSIAGGKPSYDKGIPYDTWFSLIDDAHFTPQPVINWNGTAFCKVLIQGELYLTDYGNINMGNMDVPFMDLVIGSLHQPDKQTRYHVSKYSVSPYEYHIMPNENDPSGQSDYYGSWDWGRKKLTFWITWKGTLTAGQEHDFGVKGIIPSKVIYNQQLFVVNNINRMVLIRSINIKNVKMVVTAT